MRRTVASRRPAKKRKAHRVVWVGLHTNQSACTVRLAYDDVPPPQSAYCLHEQPGRLIPITWAYFVEVRRWPSQRV